MNFGFLYSYSPGSRFNTSWSLSVINQLTHFFFLIVYSLYLVIAVLYYLHLCTLFPCNLQIWLLVWSSISNKINASVEVTFLPSISNDYLHVFPFIIDSKQYRSNTRSNQSQMLCSSMIWLLLTQHACARDTVVDTLAVERVQGICKICSVDWFWVCWPSKHCWHKLYYSIVQNLQYHAFLWFKALCARLLTRFVGDSDSLQFIRGLHYIASFLSGM